MHIFAIPSSSRHVKCYKDFFGYFNAQKTHSDYLLARAAAAEEKIGNMQKKIFVQQDDSEKINILGLREGRSGRTGGHELCRSFSQARAAARSHQQPPPAASSSSSRGKR